MGVMAKKPPSPDQPEDASTGSAQPSDGEQKKRPLSRENTRYLALPVKLYELLEQYAADQSDEDTKRSISWAGRKAVRKFLEEEGYLGKPKE